MITCLQVFLVIYLFSNVSGLRVKIHIESLPLPSASDFIQKRQVGTEACLNYESVSKSSLYLPSGLNNPWESDIVTVVNSTDVTNGIFVFYENTRVPGLGATTIQQVLDHFVSQNCYCFPYGGIVRDQFLGNPPKDLDMEVSCNINQFFQICNQMWGNLENICHLTEASKIAHVGLLSSSNGEAIDAANWDSTFFDGLLNLEYTTNSLAYDSNFNKVVIDLTGTGVQDTCNKKIRIPVSSDKWNQWYSQAKGFRFWKLRGKGYTAYNDATLNFITENVKSNIIANEQSFLKFYCSTLLGGESYNETTRICIPSSTTQCSSITAKKQTYDNLFREDLGVTFWSTNVNPLLRNFLQSCENSTSGGGISTGGTIFVTIAICMWMLLQLQ